MIEDFDVFPCSANVSSEPNEDDLRVSTSDDTPGVWFTMTFPHDEDRDGAQVLLSYRHAADLRDWLDEVIAKATSQ